MFFRQVEDPFLAQNAYLIGCQATGEALLIDPERDIDRYIELASRNNLQVVAVAETHIHADFVSGAREFAHRHPVKVYLSSEGGEEWQYQWHAEPPSKIKFLKHGDHFMIGKIELEAVHTPGHTPEHLCYMITDRGGGADDAMGIVSGDFVFVGDVGRPDLLESAAGQVGAKEPAAHALYHSLLEFFQLPDYLQVWPGHGAGSACGKALGSIPESTVGYERRFNQALLSAQSGEERFVREILHGQPEPPLYFAQMKKWNKQGPPLLPAESILHCLKSAAAAIHAQESETIVIDTRLDRPEYFTRHIPRSIWLPLTKSFPTYAGSLISEQQRIIVICYPEQAELAARLLWRVGLDNLIGYVDIDELESWFESGPVLARLATTTFAELHDHPTDYYLLDVRGESEFEEGHLVHAHCIPHTRIMTRLNELPRDKQIAVHCSAGSRSTAVASMLLRLGYNVIAVDEGIESAIPYLVQDGLLTHRPRARVS